MLLNYQKSFCCKLSAGLLILVLSTGNLLAGSGKPSDDARQIKQPNIFTVQLQHQATVCGKLVKSKWIADQQSYEALFKELFSRQISTPRPQAAVVDFSKYAMLFISMGQQRTGGYSVKLASETMDVNNNRASVSVKWLVKKPGAMAVQMLTNPCLLLRVPRGNYQAVDVVDQVGRKRQSIAVP